MDRATFCKMLVISKARSKTATIDICAGMRTMPTGVTRIEKGLNNFQMDRCLKYLSIIKYHIELDDDFGNTYAIYGNPDIIAFIKDVLSDRSKPAISKELGCDRSYLRLVLSGAHVMSVDNFLKLSDIVGYEVSLMPNANE